MWVSVCAYSPFDCGAVMEVLMKDLIEGEGCVMERRKERERNGGRRKVSG